MTAVLLTLAALAGVSALLLLATRLRFYRAWITGRLPASLDLELPTALTGVVSEREIARQRGGAIGGLAAAGVVAAGWWLGDYRPGAWPLFGVYVAGCAVGCAIAATASELRAHNPNWPGAGAGTGAGAPLSDYVSWIERWGARVAAGGAAVVLALSLAFAATGVTRFGVAHLGAGAAATAFAIVTLAGFEVAGRRIIRHPIMANGPTTRAWIGALRASAVRDLTLPPILLGAAGIAIGIGDIGVSLAADATLIGGALTATSVLLYVAALAGLILALATHPARHFLRRQWPSITADQKGSR